MAYGTLTCETTTWVMPSSMPPSSVPHSEPRPPMITASNAKIRVSAPSVGYTPVVTAFRVPASAAAAIAIPVTDANSGRTRIPCSRAMAWSSEVARTRRPQAV